MSVPFSTHSLAVANKAQRPRKRLFIDVQKRRPIQAIPIPEPFSPRSIAYSFSISKKTYDKHEKDLLNLREKAEKYPMGDKRRTGWDERIVQAQFQMAVFERNKEESDYILEWERWAQRGLKGKEPKLYTEESESLFEDLKQFSQELIESYGEKVSFNMSLYYGIAHLYTKREKNAARIFSNAIETDGSLDQKGDFFIGLGEYYFNQEDYKNAITYYKKGIDSGGSRFLRDWAYYRLGWTSFYEEDLSSTLRYWKRLLSSTQIRSVDLQNEALKNVGHILAMSGKPNEAISFYKNHNMKGSADGLHSLSRYFLSQNDLKSAAKALVLSRSFDRKSPLKPLIQKELISILYETKDFKSVFAELEKMAKFYKSSSAFGRTLNKRQSSQIDSFIQGEILYYSKLFHKQSQKEGDSRSAKLAQFGYGVLIREFPKIRSLNRIKVMMADASIQSGQASKAISHYASIAQSSKPGSTNHYLAMKKMIQVATHAADSDLKALESTSQNIKSKPRKLTAKMRNLILVCKRFMAAYQKSKKTFAQCSSYLGNMYYFSGNRPSAIKYLEIAATDLAGYKRGNDAVHKLLELIRGSKNLTLKITSKLSLVPEYRDGYFAGVIGQLRSDAKKGLLSEDNARLKLARNLEYKVLSHPKDPKAAEYLWLAGGNYFQGGDPSRGMSVWKKLVVRYAKSPFVEKALVHLGLQSEERFLFSQATKYYQTFIGRFPKANNIHTIRKRVCLLKSVLLTKDALSYCKRVTLVNQTGMSNAFGHLIRNYASIKSRNNLVQALDFASSNIRLPIEDKIKYQGLVLKLGQGRSIDQARKSIEGLYLASPSVADPRARDVIGEVWYNRAVKNSSKLGKIRIRPGSMIAIMVDLKKSAQKLPKIRRIFSSVNSSRSNYWIAAAIGKMAHYYLKISDQLEQAASRSTLISPDLAKIKKYSQNYRNMAIKQFKKSLSIMSTSKSYGPHTRLIVEGLFAAKGQNVFFADKLPRPEFVSVNLAHSLSKLVRK